MLFITIQIDKGLRVYSKVLNTSRPHLFSVFFTTQVSSLKMYPISRLRLNNTYKYTRVTKRKYAYSNQCIYISTLESNVENIRIQITGFGVNKDSTPSQVDTFEFVKESTPEVQSVLQKEIKTLHNSRPSPELKGHRII